MDQEHARARTLMRRVKEVEKTKEEGNQFFKMGKFSDAVDKYTEALDMSVPFLILLVLQN